MIKGVLFDMDGVLLNSEYVGRGLLIDLCAEMGYPAMNEAVYARMLGLTYEQDCQLLREVHGADFPSEKVLAVWRERLRAYIRSGQPIEKPYLKECFEGLRARGVRIALATGSDRTVVEGYLAHVPVMQNAFDAMVCGTEAGRGKPAPDVYLEAARRLGLRPEECMGVEDSKAGLQSLTAAGCVRVMCPDLLPCDERFAGLVDYEISDLSKLCPLIDRRNRTLWIKA